MLLKSLLLQNFRNYSQRKFDFSESVTIIVGKNTAGKTNIAEAIYLTTTGKSFRTSNEQEVIAFGHEVGRVQALVEEDEDKIKIEVVLAGPPIALRFTKKFLINGVAKSRKDLHGVLPTVLFTPEELEIITAGPSLRREFLDSVLEQVDREYTNARITYEKALRQRNALLDTAQEVGVRNAKQFEYWDNILIENGNVITQKRQLFLDFINSSEKDIFNCNAVYDKSLISKERLLQYADAEIASGKTLVGPHRDDFFIEMPSPQVEENKLRYIDIRHFGSRGQERLAVLQLKILQIEYILVKLQKKPLLILDDIFSELDESHIQLVLSKIQGQQTVLTTTHREFIPKKLLNEFSMIELEKYYL